MSPKNMFFDCLTADSFWDRIVHVSNLKFPGRDGSWMEDYTTCGSCHLVHATRSAHAPRLLQRYMIGEYPVRTRLVNSSTTFRRSAVSRPDAATLITVTWLHVPLLGAQLPLCVSNKIYVCYQCFTS